MDTHKNIYQHKAQAGFTLVELAIVMIIIGLLIGGILKGQELVANARTTSTVAQIKGIDAAISTFRDKYNGFPGDITNPNTTIPACTTPPCSTAGNGNSRINFAFTASPAGTEAQATFPQLSAGGLLSGIIANNGAVWGGIYPASNLGGGFHIGSTNGGAALNNQVGASAGGENVRGGNYLALHNTANGAVNAAGFLTPSEASRIDIKLDDGQSSFGDVVAAGNGTCANAANNYDTTIENTVCNVYIRIQQ